jgi:Ni/Fe-hydrogenase 1 B-type cytochrome subunit
LGIGFINKKQILNNDNTTTFYEKRSIGIRIWHWVFFILLTGSMITVLFASTLFRTRNNTQMVQEQLQQKGMTATSDQARAVSHAFNDKLWELHTWIGYLVAAFLLGRFILEVFQPSDELLGWKIRRAMGLRPLLPEARQEKDHYVRVKWGYVLFYFLMLVMALTGLGLAFEDVTFFRSIRGTIKQIHSLTQYAIYGFVFFHLVGVILADAGRYPGIVSGMIHGKKRI